MQLFIGNQNYSSWSLRAWLIFEQYQLNPEVIKLNLFTDAFYDTLAKYTPTAKVPTLVDEDLVVWDSLAILEYINERYLDGAAWPASIAERAKARALSAEMHSGFSDLRSELPMNIRAKRRIELSEGAKRDIARIDALWAEQQEVYPGGWLFGDWSIADAMYAPVVLRFMTYNVELSPAAQAYQQKVLESAAVCEWILQSSAETEVVNEDEAGEEL